MKKYFRFLILVFGFVILISGCDVNENQPTKRYSFPVRSQAMTQASSAERAQVGVVESEEKPNWKYLDLEFTRDDMGRIAFLTDDFLGEYIPILNQHPKYLQEYNYGDDSTRSIYWRDEKNVYFKGRKIPYADHDSFQPLHESFYAKDKYQVFYGDKIIPNADNKTFGNIDGYGFDKNHMYYENKILPLAQKDTFQDLYDDYAKTHNFVYYKGKIMKGVNPENFHTIGESSLSFYAANNENVFFKNKKVNGADPKTFRLLGIINTEVYGIDKDHIYYEGNVIPNADLQSFKILYSPPCTHFCSEEYAKDKSFYYFKGKKMSSAQVKKNFATLQMLEKFNE